MFHIPHIISTVYNFCRLKTVYVTVILHLVFMFLIVFKYSIKKKLVKGYCGNIKWKRGRKLKKNT